MDHEIGRPVPRGEDHRLLTGGGRYTDDLPFPGETFVAFLRSPRAHARIRRMNTESSRAAPSVCEVFTGGELAVRNPRTMVCEAEITGASGEPLFKPRQTILATDAVRYVGEPIAMVLAATPNQVR